MAAGVDLIELRLRNYAEVDPRSGRPWSSNALRECYRVGAARFGWGDRTPAAGSMREGNQLIGYGISCPFLERVVTREAVSLIPRATLFGNPAYLKPEISPDGTPPVLRRA